MPRDLRVCSALELPPGQARLVEVGELQIGVFHAGDAYYATDNLCPHRQSPLNEGFLEGYLITCLAHGWQFDMRTGLCDTVPGRDLATYPVRVEGDAVILTLPLDFEIAGD
jgi:nitrite reductase (NADH) small subunit